METPGRKKKESKVAKNMAGSSKGRSVREEGHAQTEKNVAKDRKQ